LRRIAGPSLGQTEIAAGSSTAPMPDRREANPLRVLGPVAIAIAFLALAAFTWLTWPDVFVDFGREFYVPMRIAEGAVLYRDLAYFNGPLSPHFNALCLRIFGASLHALFLVNLALLALLTALLYRLLVRIGDAYSALLAVLTFLSVFAFAQLTGFGNYNFVAPYSHELTHGVMLGLAGLAALACWRDTGHIRWLVAAGVLVGGALLGKPETAAAALAGGATAFVLFRRGLPAERHATRSIWVFAASFLAPPVLAAALLSTQLPVPDALLAVARPWVGLGSGETTSLAFYREGMGLDAPDLNFLQMLAWAGYWLVAFLPAILAGWKPHPILAGRGAILGACLASALYALTLFLLRDRIDWTSAARPLPVFAACALLFAARRLRQHADQVRFGLAAGLAVLSLVLLSKMLLNARFSHYGFALAFPAMALVVVAFSCWLPAELDRRGGQGALLRGAVLGALLPFVSSLLQTTASFRAEKVITVGDGGNVFKADIRGRYMNSVVTQLAASPPGTTVAVLPEGVMVNVLARRRTSLRFVNFMPPEVLLFGEDKMLADLVAHPPDKIVLVQKDTSEYGLPYFGRGYGGGLMGWIHANYHAEALIGDLPLQPGSDFGLLVLGRNGAQVK
jgi:hypothetical protein